MGSLPSEHQRGFRDYGSLWLDCSGSGLAVQGGLPSGVAFLLPPFAGGFELAVPLGEDLPVPPLELGLGRDVAEGGVQADRVVVACSASTNNCGVSRIASR